ncbi:MAG: ABC transporter permease [Oscillospiraceae bacterium]|jgi:NitT/TauT family transport system permease protein|nr:ABC transporter permease [Oscillospiraceae bacterium]
MKALKFIRKVVVAALPIIAFFLLWQLASAYVPRGVISSPVKIAQAMWKELIRVKPAMNMGGLTLLQHTARSLWRIAKGFALSGSVGIVFGFLLGTYFKSLEKLFLPFFQVCEKLNPFAIIPVFMIIFGIDESEKVAIVFWAAIWPILFNTHAGAKSVDPALVKAARTMGASRFKVFVGVILPSTLPSVFTGLKLAIRVAFFMIIAAELAGATSGIGWFYIQQKVAYKLALVYGSILLITLIAIIFNALFTRLEKHFLKWKEHAFV